MYAPKQYRPEKKRPTVNFLALPEVEPRNPVVAAPPVYAVIVEEKENADAAKKGKDEAKSIAQNKLSTDNGNAQPTQKKDAIRTENPPQFKMANDGPFQYKLQAPTQRKSGANAKAGGKSTSVDLPSELLLNLERLFGQSFSDVKVHANSPEATQAGALAFAQGTDIHFAPGQYNPTSPAGLALIGHEMAHIVQQRQGRVKATAEIDGRPVNAEAALEQEADRIGALVANGAGAGTEKTITNLAPPTVAPAQFKVGASQAPEAVTEKENEETEDNFMGLEESDHTLRFADLQENRDFDKAIDAEAKAAAEEKGQPQQMKLATTQFARTEAAAPAGEAAAGAPATVVDISHGFNPPKDVADYLNENAKKSMEINAKMGTMAKGKIKVKQTTKKVEGGATEAEYKIDTGQYLEYIGDVGFLEPLRAQGLIPVIALKATDPKAITGVLTLKTGETVLPEPKSLIQQINANLEPLGILGVEQLQVPTYTNEVIEGVLTLMAPELSTQIGGFLNASGTFGMVGNTFVFSLHADIDIKGMATGALDIARDETGKYNGTAEIGIAIENVTGNVKVIYADGKVTGRGEGGIESDKFKGTLTLIFDEKSIADQAVQEGMGLNMMEEAEGQAPASKGDGPRVVAGFGSVEVQLTPWLSATATVGIDSEGHVTIHGTMAFPDQIELMEQKDKKTDLFNLEIKAGYGVPLVGQIFLFASIGMFVKAGFGPLALHDIGMEGTYSTDPKVLNNFKITGALGISAYAQVGLSVKAGAGLTLLGHDIKAGIDLTASAGLKAYAEARPTFEYLEKDAGGQKVGEAHLKGHFEAAAQLFLELAGAFFVDLDSPWWSPVPDNHWEWPFGSMTMPIGDSMGVGADVDWLVGSPDVPELTFSPVEFDPDKFMSDMTKDPENIGQKGGQGGDKDEKGSWKGDGDASASNKTVDPKLGPVKDDKKKEPKEDLTKLPDHERYMRGLDEIGKVGEASKGKPLGKGAVAKKIRDIKSKYALNTVNQKNAKDDSVEIYVKHKDEDNTKNMIEVKLLSKAELDKQFAEAVADLEKGLKTLGHPETGAISESAAKTIAHEIDLAHEVIDGTHVTVDGDHVIIKGDLGSENRVMVTKPLAKGMDGDVGDGDSVAGPDNSPIVSKFEMDGHNHTLTIRLEGDKPTIFMASTEAQLNKKDDEFGAMYQHLLNQEGIPASIKEELEIAYTNAKAAIKALLNLPIDTFFETEKNAASLRKVKPKADGSFTSKDSNTVTSHRRDRAIGLINAALTQLKSVGKKYGIDDLSPLGLEKMKIAHLVAPLQAKVEAVIKKFKEDLNRCLPSGSKIKYRGSLANGIRSFKANTIDEAAQLINPEKFDCDAFIEVSDKEWENITSKHSIGSTGKAELAELTKWAPKEELEFIVEAIKEELLKVEGYERDSKSKEPKFSLFVQSANKTKGQERYGNNYPEGALTAAGLPLLEQSLEESTVNYKLGPKPNQKEVKNVPSRRLPVKSKEVDLS